MPSIPFEKLVDGGAMNIQLGEYASGPARALLNPFYHLQAQEHRRMLSAKMVGLDKDGMKAKMPETDYFVSRKVDGEFNFLIVDDGSVCMINPYGTCRTGLPLMIDAAKLVKDAGHKQAILAGEFHLDGKERTRISDLLTIARGPESDDDLKRLHFAVFDIVQLDGEPAGKTYAEIWKRIESIFKGGGRVFPVETVKAKDIAQAVSTFEKWVEKEDAEGIVARSDTAGMYKVKLRLSVDVSVLGFTEGTEDRTGMLHDMLVGIVRNDGAHQILGRVGGGFTDEQRRQYLQDLKDMPAESDYTEVNDAVAYQMVRPEWVIEISCLDLISQTTRGATVDRMVLNYDSDLTKYGIVRRMPLASPISPVFIRMRDDKRVQPQDVRIAQVSDVVEVPYVDKSASSLTLPGSELLKREVFVKTLKGALMVRKFMMWKTNKEGEVGGGDWPAYVAYYCDFSPNRKTPLDREIRVSNSKDQIQQLYQSLLEANVKKGWEPVGR